MNEAIKIMTLITRLIDLIDKVERIQGKLTTTLELHQEQLTMLNERLKRLEDK